jgi:hypothetical protein
MCAGGEANCGQEAPRGEKTSRPLPSYMHEPEDARADCAGGVLSLAACAAASPASSAQAASALNNSRPELRKDWDRWDMAYPPMPCSSARPLRAFVTRVARCGGT